MFDGRALVIVSPAVERHTAAGIPYGSASGFLYENASRMLRRAYAVPYDVFAISDYDAKYYMIMRHALDRNVTFLASPNPSTILRLLAVAAEYGETLIRDIRDGTISEDLAIEPALRRRLAARVRPNPARANWSAWWSSPGTSTHASTGRIWHSSVVGREGVSASARSASGARLANRCRCVISATWQVRRT